MRSVFYLFLLCCLISTFSLFAQEKETIIDNNAEKVSLGIGMGLDYGGIGGNILLYPQENIGFFGGVGYAIAGMGYNVGAKIRFLSEKKTRTNFFLIGMYGYNAAIAVTNATSYNKLFYGTSFGLGIDTGKRSYKKGFWTMALLFPVRDSAVNDYIDYLKDDVGVDFKNGLWPITFSIGYRFGLD